jgi:tetratricopeptide (TPR) repeat protein
VTYFHGTDLEACLFAFGRLEGTAFQDFLRHMLSGCAECRRKLLPYAPFLCSDEPEPPEVPEEALDEYDAVLDRVFAGVERQTARWAEEKADLGRLLARMRERPYEGSLEIFDGLAERSHGWAWIEAILALSFDLRYRDPLAMRFLTWAASEAVQHLDEREVDRGRYTPVQLADLHARTLIELANAERLIDRFSVAEDVLAKAAGKLQKGSDDPLIAGRFLDVEASLRMDQRRLDDALGLLDQAHGHYLILGETHLAGRILISKGIALRRDDRPDEAVGVLREGLCAIDPQRDAKLVATGQQALLDALVDTGGYVEAGEVLMESGLRQAFSNDPLNLLKLRWVEGKIFAGLGKLGRAEEIFSETKEEFLAREQDYVAAMLNLELAGVLLRQGRADEVEELAEEALEIFRDLGIDREALRAVRYLREACRQRVATAELIEQVVSFLNRLERWPGLRFVL